jgi:hypothetical protein
MQRALAMLIAGAMCGGCLGAMAKDRPAAAMPAAAPAPAPSAPASIAPAPRSLDFLVLASLGDGSRPIALVGFRPLEVAVQLE